MLKIQFAAASLAVLIGSLSAFPVLAQSVQGYEAAEQAQINQAQAAGAITPFEASKLDAKEAQIQAQQQQYLMQNGGRLTGQERHHLMNEVNGLNNHLRSDEVNTMQNGGMFTGMHRHHHQWQNGQQYPGSQIYAPNGVPNIPNAVPYNVGGSAYPVVNSGPGYPVNSNPYAPGYGTNYNGYPGQGTGVVNMLQRFMQNH